MLTQRGVWPIYIVLVTEAIVVSLGHSDCNHQRVMDRFFYMCNSFTAFPSKKRETNGVNEGNFGDSSSYYLNQNPLMQVLNPNPVVGEPVRVQVPQQPQFQATDGNYPPGGNSMHTNAYPFPNALSYNDVNGRPHNQIPPELNTIQDHRSRRRYPGPASLPNEPEDFESFNSWYLNPVYAEADWQSAIERWRRRANKKEVSKEIWNFVENKCCVTGCPFPQEFLELDKRINICGMR